MGEGCRKGRGVRGQGGAQWSTGWRPAAWTHLHGVVQLLILALLLNTLFLLLQELLSLEVACGSMFHGVVGVLGVCL